MIQIKNLQNLKRINKVRFCSEARKALKYLGLSGKSISVVFCGNNFIRKLNKRYFRKNKPTDVISFYLQDEFSPSFLGEIVISVEEALVNCKRYGLSLHDELILYAVHGLLHLLGYKDYSKKDKQAMEAKQNEVLNYLTYRLRKNNR